MTTRLDVSGGHLRSRGIGKEFITGLKVAAFLTSRRWSE